MTIGSAPICFACVRFCPWDGDNDRAYCAAFPDGIPDAILFNGLDHRQPYVDHGIRFVLDPDRKTDLNGYERVKALLL